MAGASGRGAGLAALMLCLALIATACGGDDEQGTGQAAPRQEQTATNQTQTQEEQAPAAATGTIVGRATDEDSGRPLSDVYIVVGYKGVQRAAVTGPDGRYVVPEVPAGEPAAILGFHENNYRYHNSRFDADVVPRLQPGETFDYDFTVRKLEPRGQPEVTDAAIGTETARPGDTVEFGLTVTEGGEGGLSEEVFAASPELGRVAWLRPAEGNRFRGALTIPRDTPPGDYQFAFFAASKKCYDPETFPRRVLRVVAP